MTGAGERAFSAGSDVKAFEVAPRRRRPRRTSRARKRRHDAPGQPAHADDRGDRGQRARRRPGAGAGLRHPRRLGDAPSSGCPRSAWRSRPARAARSACRASSASARAKELTLTGRIIDAARGGADRPRQPGRAGRPGTSPPPTRSRRRSPSAARSRCARQAADRRSVDLDIDAGIAAEIEASERVFDSEDMLEGAARLLRKATRPTLPRDDEMTDDRPLRRVPALLHLGGRRTRAGPGIKEFARTVEDLGFDSLFITDHLLAAKRFYSVSFLEPLSALAVAAGVTERVRLGTSILIMPLRNPVMLAKELATLQFLSENRLILGAGVGWNEAEYDGDGRAQVGARQAHRRDARHHDPAARGRDGHVPRPLLLGRRAVHRAAHAAAARDLDRRRLAAGRPQVARPAALRRVGQGARRCAPTAGSRARPARPTTSRATGASCRTTSARTAATRASASSPTRTSCTWS